MPGKYRLYTGKDKKFYFQLKATNGQVILQSQGYKSRSGATNGIASVQKNCGDKNRFEAKQAKNGKHHFVLKAGNGQTIGQSEIYDSTRACSNGINSVSKNGSSTKVDDDT